MPFDPVTWIDAALVSVTVRVSVCPDEMLLELAVIETVGTAAEALVAKTETTTKERMRMRDRIVFTGACLVFVFFRRRLGTRLFDSRVDSREISLHFDASKAARSWSASPIQPAQFLNGPATPLKSPQKNGTPATRTKPLATNCPFHPCRPSVSAARFKNRRALIEIRHQRKWPPPATGDGHQVIGS